MPRRVQRNVDFTVSGADCRRVAQGQIEIHRQSNVLDYQVNLILGNNAPDHIFDLVEHLLRLFGACTNRGTNVEAKLAGVHIREKIFAEKWVTRTSERTTTDAIAPTTRRGWLSAHSNRAA